MVFSQSKEENAYFGRIEQSHGIEQRIQDSANGTSIQPRLRLKSQKQIVQNCGKIQVLNFRRV